MKELFISPQFQLGLILGSSFTCSLMAGGNVLRGYLRRRNIHRVVRRGLISHNEARALLFPPSQPAGRDR